MCITTIPAAYQATTSLPSLFNARDLIKKEYMPKNQTVKIQEERLVVQHNYHDHSNDLPDGVEDKRPCRGGVAMPFPIKLYEMLERVEEDGHAGVVSWQPHGRCFVIHKPKEFKELLSKYFKFSKITSFQRQLNLYGFSRLTRGKDKGGYYHELFLRGKLFLAGKIHRIKVKGTGVRGRTNPTAEPDLWGMKWVGNKSNTFPESADSSESISSSQSCSRNSSSDVNSITNSSCSEQEISFPAPVINSNPIVKQFVAKIVPVVQDDDDDDDDVIYSWGGMHFHYLDASQLFKSKKVQPVPIQPDDMNDEKVDTFISNLHLDDVCTNIKQINDDSVFVDILEQVIS